MLLKIKIHVSDVEPASAKISDPGASLKIRIEPDTYFTGNRVSGWFLIPDIEVANKNSFKTVFYYITKG